jgi:hypothetical protein
LNFRSGSEAVTGESRLNDAVAPGAARAAVNQLLGAPSLEKRPDKTFVGPIEQGFDFLGYHFGPAGLAVAKQTITNFMEKASRLYEQERRAASAASPLGMYVRRWLRWARSGMESHYRGTVSITRHFSPMARG